MLADFKASLPETMRGHASLAKVDSLENMAQSYIAAQRMIGKDPQSLVEMPKSDATFEERLPILQKLGAPSKVDGYKLSLPEGTPEKLAQALDVNLPMGKAFLEVATKTGVFPEQAQAMYGMMAQHLGAAMQEMGANTEADHGKNIEAIKTEAGPAFDDWIKATEFGIQKLGGDPLRDLLNNAGLGTNPLIVKAFMQAGKMMAEDTIPGGGTGGRFGTMAPAEARAQGTALLTKAHAEKNPVERRRLNNEAQKFFAMATGEKAPAA